MIPDKTGHPLYTTSPDCNGLITAFVWPGLVFFGPTSIQRSFDVGSSQNQSNPDAEKQTRDRLVRPDFMYQTERKMCLVLTFWYSFWSLPGYRHLAPMSAPVAGTALGWARGRTGRESLRQGERGAHVGLEYATPLQSAARCGTMKGCNIERFYALCISVACHCRLQKSVYLIMRMYHNIIPPQTCPRIS